MFRWSYHWNSHSTTFHHVRGRHPLGLVGDPRRWMERHHLVVADLKDARPFEGSCQPCCGASNKLNMHTHTDLLVRTHIYIYTDVHIYVYVYIYILYILYIYTLYYIYIYIFVRVWRRCKPQRSIIHHSSHSTSGRCYLPKMEERVWYPLCGSKYHQYSQIKTKPKVFQHFFPQHCWPLCQKHPGSRGGQVVTALLQMCHLHEVSCHQALSSAQPLTGDLGNCTQG